MSESFNAANPEQVRKRKQTAKDQQEQQQLELKGLLALPEFRRFVWRLIGDYCRLFESPGSANGSIQSTAIGRGDVGRELWAEIERADPLKLPQMMSEHWAAHHEQ